jgi:hypothetical protein
MFRVDAVAGILQRVLDALALYDGTYADGHLDRVFRFTALRVITHLQIVNAFTTRLVKILIRIGYRMRTPSIVDQNDDARFIQNRGAWR